MRFRFLIVYIVVQNVCLAFAQGNCEMQFCENLYKKLSCYKKVRNREIDNRVLLSEYDYKKVEVDVSCILLVPSLYLQKTCGKQTNDAQSFLCLLDLSSFRIHTSVLLTDSVEYYIRPENKVEFPVPSDVKFRVTAYEQDGKTSGKLVEYLSSHYYVTKRGKFGVLSKMDADYFCALSETLDSIHPDFYFSVCGDLSNILYVKDGKVGVLHFARRDDGECVWEDFCLERYVATEGTPGNDPCRWRKVKKVSR